MALNLYNNVAIYDTSICAAVADQANGLLIALKNGTCGYNIDDEITVPCADGYRLASVITAQVNLVDCYDPNERMCYLWQSALRKLIANLGEEAKILIVTLLPTKASKRYEYLDVKDWQHKLGSLENIKVTTDFEYYTIDKCATKLLVELCERLKAGDYAAIIFGGVDSLIDKVTCMELVQQDLLMAEDRAFGLVPGEAAAFVKLEKFDANKSNLNFAQVKCLSYIEQSSEGLTHSISEVLEQVLQCQQSIDTVVLPCLTLPKYVNLWHQTQQSLKINVDLSNIISASTVLGEVGAANFPMNIILACQHLALCDQREKVALIGDMDIHYPNYGAVLLKKRGK